MPGPGPADQDSLRADGGLRPGDDHRPGGDDPQLRRRRLEHSLRHILLRHGWLLRRNGHITPERVDLLTVRLGVLPGGALHVPPAADLLVLQPQQCVVGYKGDSQQDQEDQRGRRISFSIVFLKRSFEKKVSFKGGSFSVFSQNRNYTRIDTLNAKEWRQ